MDIDKIIRRIAWSKVINECSIFKALYKTSDGAWTEDINKANWQHFTANPKSCLICDCTHVHYFVVDGVEYRDINDAVDAMQEDLMRSYCVCALLSEENGSAEFS